jgi:Neuraminidase (sialidase)
MGEKFAKITICISLTEDEAKTWNKTNEIQFSLKEKAESLGREVVYAGSEIVSENQL